MIQEVLGVVQQVQFYWSVLIDSTRLNRITTVYSRLKGFLFLSDEKRPVSLLSLTELGPVTTVTESMGWIL